MAGYIEHLGTGTTDMIADCEALGLRTPEFIQADDFRTIIYRQEKVSNQTEKVTERPQKVTEREKIENRATRFIQYAEPRKSIRLTMITSFGLKPNTHSSIIQSQITLDDLFHA